MGSTRATAATLVLLAALASACGGGTQDRAATGPSTSTSTIPASTTSGQSDRTPGTTGCGSVQALTTVAYRRVDGVPAEQTSLDVHVPPGSCGAPVVMWVHGGGWVRGDKANQMVDKVRFAADHGWILVSVNYRLTAPGTPVGPGLPDQYGDLAAAVGWVHTNIGRFGGDPSRLALLGHSAGADLVANVSTNPTYLAQQDLHLDVLSCAGPLDTEGFDKPDDPATSATHLVRPGVGIPPTIGVVRGTARRQAVEAGFLDALAAAGVPTTRIDARSLTHEEVNRRIGATGDTVMTPALAQFLHGCLDAPDGAG